MKPFINVHLKASLVLFKKHHLTLFIYDQVFNGQLGAEIYQNQEFASLLKMNVVSKELKHLSLMFEFDLAKLGNQPIFSLYTADVLSQHFALAKTADVNFVLIGDLLDQNLSKVFISLTIFDQKYSLVIDYDHQLDYWTKFYYVQNQFFLQLKYLLTKQKFI